MWVLAYCTVQSRGFLGGRIFYFHSVTFSWQLCVRRGSITHGRSRTSQKGNEIEKNWSGWLCPSQSRSTARSKKVDRRQTGIGAAWRNWQTSFPSSTYYFSLLAMWATRAFWPAQPGHRSTELYGHAFGQSHHTCKASTYPNLTFCVGTLHISLYMSCTER